MQLFDSLRRLLTGPPASKSGTAAPASSSPPARAASPAPAAEQYALSRDQVVWAYRLFLDRDPESEAVVVEKQRAWTTTRDLRLGIMTSREFRENNPDLAFSRERNVVIAPLDGGLRLFVDLSDYVIGLRITRGAYETDELAFVRRTVKPGQTALDVGANVGFFTIHLAALVGPSGHVYAFEPLEGNADLLDRSIAENGFGDRITLERAAVAERAGAAELVVAKHALSSGGSYVATGDTTPHDHERRPIHLVALDDQDLRRPVEFVKLDVEGAELRALRGARRILCEDRPVILSEVNAVQLQQVSGCRPADLVAELGGLDYTAHLLAGDRLESSLPDLDSDAVRSVVFLPKD